MLDQDHGTSKAARNMDFGRLPPIDTPSDHPGSALIFTESSVQIHLVREPGQKFPEKTFNMEG